jgi:hypothetical protein
VSDLDDDPGDVPRVTLVALSLQRLGIPIHVVGLNPSPQNARFFRRLVGPQGSVTESPSPGHARSASASTSFPVALAVVAALVALLLAANELWGARLRWGVAS